VSSCDSLIDPHEVKLYPITLNWSTTEGEIWPLFHLEDTIYNQTMTPEQLTDINALDLDDTTLKMLSYARYLGLTDGKVDRLADGGAQLIRSVGRDKAVEVFPNGIHVQLNTTEMAELQTILNDENLALAIEYIESLFEMNFWEKLMLMQHFYDELRCAPDNS